jgi:hypothetical protein
MTGMTGPHLAEKLIEALNDFAGRKGVVDAYDIATSIIVDMAQHLPPEAAEELEVSYADLIGGTASGTEIVEPPEAEEPRLETEALIRDLPPVPEAEEISKIVKRLLG